MLQYAGSAAAAGFQTGTLRVTAATGSPIAFRVVALGIKNLRDRLTVFRRHGRLHRSFGIDAPKLSAVQSDSASFLALVCPHKNPVAAQNAHISRRFMSFF
jgi:hypothetical protein